MNSAIILKIVEIIVVVVSVIGLVACGIFIGREFGTFEGFVVALLKKVEKAIKGDREE